MSQVSTYVLDKHALGRYVFNEYVAARNVRGSPSKGSGGLVNVSVRRWCGA